MIQYDSCSLRLRNIQHSAAYFFALDTVLGVPCSRISVIIVYGFFHNVLNFRIQCGIYVQPSGLNKVDSLLPAFRPFPVIQLHQLINQIVDSVFNKIRMVIQFLITGFFQHNKTCIFIAVRIISIKFGFFIFCLRNKAIFIHQPKHQICSFISNFRLFPAVKIKPGIISVGILSNSYDGCAFPQSQILQFLTEIVQCGCFYPVITASQVNCIQICFQDFFLFIFIFQLNCQICFLNFTLIGLFGAEKSVFYQLLCNSAATLYGFTSQVIDKGTCQTFIVQSLVYIKPNIFSGNQSILQHLGNFFQRCPYPVFQSLVLGNQIAILIIYE